MSRAVPLLLSLSLLSACHSNSAAVGSGTVPDAGPITAITATPGTWTWVDFANSSCNDGTPTGIGVNPSATSSNVLIYFEGGGACWDSLTCLVLMTSTGGPFGNSAFQATIANFGGSVIDRTLTNNPFQDWNLVFVPYCTGDLHAGDNLMTYTSGNTTTLFHHKGRINVLAYLQRLGVTFPAPAKVAISGSSAGGFGAVLNYDAFRKQWPAASMYLIDDSGPFLQADDIPPTIRADFFSSWNLAETTGPVCGTACQGDLSLMYPKLAALYPHDRMSLLSYEQDSVIPSYFQLTESQFQADLQSLDTSVLTPIPLFHPYFVNASSHVLLGNPNGISQGGTVLNQFLRLQVTDDASWSAVRP